MNFQQEIQSKTMQLLEYTDFFYKQLVYKQPALEWKIAKQLSFQPSFTKQQ